LEGGTYKVKESDHQFKSDSRQLLKYGVLVDIDHNDDLKKGLLKTG